MKIIRMSFHVTAIMAVILLSACTSTKFSSVWKEEAYQGHPVRIMVVNALQNPATRRLFEDEMVSALKDRKLDAVASYPFLSDQLVSDKNAISAQARGAGADTILINKPVGSRTEEAVGPWEVYADVYVSTQTNIYDINADRLIFSASADTWIRQDVPSAVHVKSLVKDLMKELTRQGIF